MKTGHHIRGWAANRRPIFGLAALLVSPILLGHAYPQTQASPTQGDAKRLKLMATTSSEMVFDIEESRDGSRIITRLKRDRNDSLASVKMWDPKTMKTLALLGGYGQEIRKCFFTYDSKYVVTHTDKIVRVYSAAKGRLAGEFPLDSSGWIDVRASQNSKFLVGTTNTGSVIKWPILSPKDAVTYKGTAGGVADISPDGSAVIVAEGSKTNLLGEDMKLAKPIKATGAFTYLEFSPDGKQVVATDTNRKKVALIDIATASQVHEAAFVPSTERFATAFMSSAFVGPDRNWYYGVDGTGLFTFFDRNTKAVVRTWQGHTEPVREIRISPDGTQIGTYGDDNQLKLYSIPENKEHPFVRFTGTPTAGAFDSKSKYFWVGYGGGQIVRHGLNDGTKDVMVNFYVPPPTSVEFFDNGRKMYVGVKSEDFGIYEGVMANIDNMVGPNTIMGNTRYPVVAPNGMFELVGIDEDYLFKDRANPASRKDQKTLFKNCNNAYFSPDSTRFITVHEDGKFGVWDSANMDLVAGFELNPEGERLGECTFSPDGTLMLTTGYQKVKNDKEKALLWNPFTGDIKHTFEGYDFLSKSVFSPDGKVVYLKAFNEVVGYNVETGKVVVTMKDVEDENQSGHYYGVSKPHISAKGKYLYLVHGAKMTIWNTQTGAKVRTIRGAGEGQINAEETHILACRDNHVEVIDIATGAVQMSLEHDDRVTQALYTPNGKRIVTLDPTGNISIWDLKPGPIAPGDKIPGGKKVGSMMVGSYGDWLVMDESGRFDAHDPGNVQTAAYVMEWEGGLEPIAVSQLKAQYYEPGLLSKLLGNNDNALREVPPVQSIRLYPTVSFDQAAGELGMVKIGIQERDKGGIGEIDVAINGKTVLTKDGSGFFEFNPADYKRFLLPESVLPGGSTNVLTVTVTNEDGDLVSPPAALPLGIPADLKAPQVKLYALCVGVGDYVGSGGDLMAPPSDATGIGTALQRVSSRLLKSAPEITIMTTKDKENSPARSRIMKWFEDTSKVATSSDIIFVFFAGHGTDKVGGQSGYFFLTQDADPTSLTAGALGTSTISGDDLKAALAKIPAGKQVVILDTCHSGAAGKSLLNASRSVSGDYQRAYESIKDATGTWMLAGSASDQLSYEAANVDHGMLTYSLLEAIDNVSPDAMREGTNGDMFVDVERWLTYAANRVDSLKAETGVEGVQRPEFKRSKASQSFDIGVTGKDHKGEVGLTSPKPIVIVGTFQMDEEDPIGLERVVGDLSRTNSHIKAWFDIAKHPNVYRIAGQYSVEGKTIKLKVFLQQFDLGQNRKTIATFDVTGESDKLADLAKEALSHVTDKIEELEAAKGAKSG